MYTDAPILTLLPGDSPYHVNVNQHVQISCIAKGLPLPVVQWFSNGIAVSSVGQLQASVTVQTSYPHNAMYTCVGMNKIDKMEHKRNASITVIVGRKIANVYIHVCITIISMIVMYNRDHEGLHFSAKK